MSEQERMLQFEIQKMKEEEAARAKIEMQSRKLKADMQAEERHSKINRLKVRAEQLVVMAAAANAVAGSSGSGGEGEGGVRRAVMGSKRVGPMVRRRSR